MKCLSPVEDTDEDLVICEECHKTEKIPSVTVAKRIVLPPPSDTIRDMELKMLDFQTAIEALHDIIRAKKKFYVDRVEKEWTSTKNPDLSNQTKRNAVVDDELVEDADYTLATDELNKTTLGLSLLRIDHSYEVRQHQRKMTSIQTHRIDRIEHRLDEM